MTTHLSWEFICVLPNVTARSAIEWDWVALVPITDDRVKALEQLHPLVKQYMASFTDPFARRIQPAVLLAIRPAGGQVASEPIMDFRNAIAIACIIEGYRCKISNGSLPVPVYSESFDMYPIAPSRDYEDLIGNTPAMLSLDSIDGFRGQSSPGIGHSGFRAFDQEIYSVLKDAWYLRYARDKGDSSRYAQLFRSLEVAYHAAVAGLMYSPTQHAIGIKLALWVSAFEVLAYDDKANKNRVIKSFFNNRSFKNEQLRQPDFEQGWNLLSKLYAELDDVRNRFIHGDPVSFDRLYPFCNSGNKPYTAIAPLLYKIALIRKQNYEFASDYGKSRFENGIVEYLKIAVPYRSKPPDSIT